MSRDEIHRLAQLAARLMPDRRDPEAFHIAKSELVSGLRKLASAPGGTGQQLNGTTMTKHVKDMTEAEYRENRSRIRHGQPPLFAADDHGRQTTESKVAERERREAGRQRVEARIAKRFS
jgi:hypothetical protein